MIAVVAVILVLISALIYTIIFRVTPQQKPALVENKQQTIINDSTVNKDEIDSTNTIQPTQDNSSATKQYVVGDYFLTKDKNTTFIDSQHNTGIELDIPNGWSYDIARLFGDRYRMESKSPDKSVAINIEIGNIYGGVEAYPDSYEVLRAHNSLAMDSVPDKYLIEQIYCDKGQDSCRYTSGIGIKNNYNTTVGYVVNKISSSYEVPPIIIDKIPVVAYIKIGSESRDLSFSEASGLLNSGLYIQAKTALKALRINK